MLLCIYVWLLTKQWCHRAGVGCQTLLSYLHQQLLDLPVGQYTSPGKRFNDLCQLLKGVKVHPNCFLIGCALSSTAC
jgi:hypothetical protein